MSEKKVGKRLLTWVLVLVMTLSLLPLNVLADVIPETDGGAQQSAMNFTKTADGPDANGNYTITMTAQATSKEVETTKTVPMDIVLVLDQSGSMADDFNGNSTNNNEDRRQYAMKEAVNSFIGEVADKYSDDADHRMAIVTFDSNAAELVGWTEVNPAGKSKLEQAIKALPPDPKGATNVGEGMELAQSLMNSSEADTGRQKTVIVFTDGVPTKSDVFDTDVANTAITAAKNMKDDKVTIYTVGIFNGANPEQLYGDSEFDKNSNGTVGSNWSDFSFWKIGDIQNYDVPAGNRFLNYLSSNFESAAKIGLKPYKATFFGIGYRGWEITENFDRDSSDYYLTASDASSLNGIFKIISDTIVKPVDEDLNVNTKITDTLSNYFTFAGVDGGDVKVYAEKGNDKREITNEVTVNLNTQTKTVTVTGYDFSAHYQGIGGNAEETLVIEIKVKPSGGEGYTSKDIPTNEGNATVTLGEKEIDKAAPPTVDGYSVEYAIGDNASWPNNGNGPEKLYYPQGADVTVTNSVPTRDGYEFTGWTITKPETNSPEINTDETTGKKTFTMPAANVTLTAQWETKTDLSYTVNYLEKATNKVLHEPKTVSDVAFEAVISSVNEKINIDGYNFDSVDKETLTITTGENVINIYYTKRGDLSYTVNYLEKTTNKVLHEPKTVSDVAFEAVISSVNEKINIDGYNFDSVDKETLTIGTGENVINIYYTKKGSSTFDFNDVDGKGAHAITKTVTGNVSTSFTDKFEVTVTPKSDNAKSTMTDTSYTGAANVTYSDRTKVAFDFGTNSKLNFNATGDYTYAVQERKGTSNYMSYDTTAYTLTIKVDLNMESTAYEVTSWYFTAGMKEYAIKTPLNITNTYYKPTYRPPTPTVVIPDDDALGLNTTDHFAYIVGYGNGEVRPQNNITRAEVATIFFRLLTDDVRDENLTKTNRYSDVAATSWYNTAVSTLSSMGIITGYPDGTFRPNAAITRAEFAAIAARFDHDGDKTAAKFSDIANHWAKDEISIAYNNGWITGYPDGTFGPQRDITRAETVTLVNRVLNRQPETEDDLLPNMTVWTDNANPKAWYYLAVQEATNSHYYKFKTNSKYEKWTELRETRDWTQLEK